MQSIGSLHVQFLGNLVAIYRELQLHVRFIPSRLYIVRDKFLFGRPMIFHINTARAAIVALLILIININWILSKIGREGTCRLKSKKKLFVRRRFAYSQSFMSRWNFQKLRLLTYGVEVTLKSPWELFNRIQPWCSCYRPYISGLIIFSCMHAIQKVDLHPPAPGRAKLVPLYCAEVR